MIAKTNQKMQSLIQDIRDSKRKEYLDFISKDASDTPPSEHELIEKEQLVDALTHGLLPYEIEMVGGEEKYESMKSHIHAALRGEIEIAHDPFQQGVYRPRADSDKSQEQEDAL